MKRKALQNFFFESDLIVSLNGEYLVYETNF